MGGVKSLNAFSPSKIFTDIIIYAFAFLAGRILHDPPI